MTLSYIRKGRTVMHVHMKDAQRCGSEIEYTLMGEGELPFNEVMNALRSVNYDGFMSLEWDPKLRALHLFQ